MTNITAGLLAFALVGQTFNTISFLLMARHHRLRAVRLERQADEWKAVAKKWEETALKFESLLKRAMSPMGEGPYR